jgi:hypothetical protein
MSLAISQTSIRKDRLNLSEMKVHQQAPIEEEVNIVEAELAVTLSMLPVFKVMFKEMASTKKMKKKTRLYRKNLHQPNQLAILVLKVDLVFKMAFIKMKEVRMHHNNKHLPRIEVVENLMPKSNIILEILLLCKLEALQILELEKSTVKVYIFIFKTTIFRKFLQRI